MPARSHRISIDLSNDWEFRKGRVAKSWLTDLSSPDADIVSLPHSWNATDTYHENVAYYRGPGAYKRTFALEKQLPDIEKRLWRIESEGFYGTGEAWLNGQLLDKFDGQYLGFSIEPGQALTTEGDNLLAIKLTNRCKSHVLPGIKMPDFILHGGLAGRIRLVGIPLLHIDQTTLSVVCKKTSETDYEVCVDADICNRSTSDQNCSITWTILDENKAEVAKIESDTVSLQSGATERIALTAPVSSPATWSPDSPTLYSAVGQLSNDTFNDSITQQFGFREIEFSQEGFFINGKRTELRGCNRHESMPGFGNALPISFHYRDAKIIKELGLNFVRLSHYPQHPAFLDACDQLGIMVYAEIATWKSVRTGRWLRSACKQMNDMVLRDRNHPSVILWGMGNESRSRAAYTQLAEVARDLDPTRSTTYAENHLYRARRKDTIQMTDVWASNYELEILDDCRDASRLKSVLVSECSNYPHAIRGRHRGELTQVEMIEKDLRTFENKPYVAGFTLWSFNDYATLRKKRFRRFCGIVDAWRLPKMSAAFLTARHDTEPFLKTYRTEDGRLEIFTNCEKVTVARYGQVLCELEGGPHRSYQLPQAEGNLLLTGTYRGKEIQETVTQEKRPASIALVPETHDATSSEHETIGITIHVLDVDGNPAVSYNGEAETTVTGPAVLRSYAENGTVTITAGLGRLFVQSNGNVGTADVTVALPGFPAGKTEVRFSEKQQ